MHAVSLDELSTEELSAAANANFVTHAGWVQQRAAGMDVDEAQVSGADRFRFALRHIQFCLPRPLRFE